MNVSLHNAAYCTQTSRLNNAKQLYIKCVLQSEYQDVSKYGTAKAACPKTYWRA